MICRTADELRLRGIFILLSESPPGRPLSPEADYMQAIAYQFVPHTGNAYSDINKLCQVAADIAESLKLSGEDIP